MLSHFPEADESQMIIKLLLFNSDCIFNFGLENKKDS